MPRQLSRRKRINLEECLPALQADHRDGDTDNNDPDDLVPACGSCNSARRQAGNPRYWKLATVERERERRALEQVKGRVNPARAQSEREDSWRLRTGDSPVAASEIAADSDKYAPLNARAGPTMHAPKRSNGDSTPPASRQAPESLLRALIDA